MLVDIKSRDVPLGIERVVATKVQCTGIRYFRTMDPRRYYALSIEYVVAIKQQGASVQWMLVDIKNYKLMVVKTKPTQAVAFALLVANTGLSA
jgi:hypothetical protein